LIFITVKKKYAFGRGLFFSMFLLDLTKKSHPGILSISAMKVEAAIIVNTIAVLPNY